VAQVDFFLKIDSIDGESVVKGLEKWIEVQSFSWGMSQSGGAGGGGAGKVVVQDFHFVARTGLQSPLLLTATGTGQHFKKATLSVREAGGDRQLEYIKVNLTDVLVSSYQVGGTDAGEDNRPSDQISLTFQRVEMDVSAQGADGTLKTTHGSWDLKTNSKA